MLFILFCIFIVFIIINNKLVHGHITVITIGSILVMLFICMDIISKSEKCFAELLFSEHILILLQLLQSACTLYLL